MYSPLGLVIFVAVEGTFVRFTKGHISNSIRCGCLRCASLPVAAAISYNVSRYFVFNEVVRYSAHRVWYSFASVIHDFQHW